jgi:hypothetical protein
MQTLVIDTNGIVKKLEQRGFSRAQAEGITEALKELDASSLVTKTDLELALAKATTTIVTWMAGRSSRKGRSSWLSSSFSSDRGRAALLQVPNGILLLLWFDRHIDGFPWNGIVNVLHAPRDVQCAHGHERLHDHDSHDQIARRYPHDRTPILAASASGPFHARRDTPRYLRQPLAFF